MAAEESSQGAALGPDLSGIAGGNPPAGQEIPSLDDVLGELMEACCVVQVVSHVLTDLSAVASERVGACANVLKRGCQMLDIVYERFDEALLGYRARNHYSEDDAERAEYENVRPRGYRGHRMDARGTRRSGKRKRLARGR